MTCTAVPVALEAILPLRDLYLEEMAAQVRYHACHERGWTDSYLLRVEGETVGYASIKGQEITDRDTVFEFFVAPSHRRWARDLLFSIARSRPTDVGRMSVKRSLTDSLRVGIRPRLEQ